MKLRCQHPTLEDLLLLRGAVTVHLHEGAAAAQALDLPHGQNRAGPGKVMDGVDRKHTVERAVRKRQPFRGSKVQSADDLLLAVHERIERDIQAEYFQARTFEHQILDEKSLAAANIEHMHARTQAEVGNNVSRHGPP